MVKGVIFDLDGTLLDTISDIHAVLNQTLAKFGYPLLSKERMIAYVGDGARQLIMRSLPGKVPNEEEVFEYYTRTYANSENALTRPFDGAIEVLKRLSERGIKLAIVTNKPHGATERVVKQYLSEIPFAFVAGDSGNFPVKPDPTLARFAALTMRLFPEECAFVGDGEPDAQTAINAGMFGISCLWGYRSKEELEAVGATRFVSDFYELEKILENS